jgi:hypothetical protein
MKRILFFATFLYAVTTHAVLTLPDKAELGLPANYALNGGVERGLATFARYNDSFTVTITNATPAVVTSTATVPALGDGIVFTTTGSLPTGLTANTVYYVVATAQGGTYGFTVSATKGGTAIATTTAGSGVHTASPTRPYKGLGGTPTHVALTSSNVSPIQGARSLLVTNSGSTAATGEGFSIPLSIDLADRGVMLNVSFSYVVQSGTFQVGNTTTTPLTDSDLEVFLWDVTNGVAIQVAPTLLQCGGVGLKCDYVGQTVVPTGSSSYRLLFHTVTPNALAWSVKFDSFNVSRAVRSQGLAGSQLTLAGVNVVSTGTKGTVTNDAVYSGRVGDHGHFVGQYKQTAAGAAGSGEMLFSLPNGVSFDATKVVFYTGAGGGGVAYPTASTLGKATFSDGASEVEGSVIPYNATQFRLGGLQIAGNGYNRGILSSGFFGFSAATFTFSYDFFAPIAGWNVGTATSDQAPSVPVQLSVYQKTSQAIGTGLTALIYDTVITDTHAGYSTTSGGYTFKVPGWYHCDYRYGINSSSTASAESGYLLLDGVNVCSDYKTNSGNAGIHVSCGKDFNANAGQVLTVKGQGQYSNGTIVGPDQTFLTCHKTNQGLGITQADPLTASYYLSTSTAVTAQGVIKYDTKVDDPLGAYNPTTGTFTCLQGGKFTIAVTGSTNTTGGIYGKLNGSSIGALAMPTGGQPPTAGGTSFRCATGGTLQILNEVAATLSGPSTLYGPINFFTITRTGP